MNENKYETCEEEEKNFNPLFLLCLSYNGLKILRTQKLFLKPTWGICK